jgi:hypothetical protein
MHPRAKALAEYARRKIRDRERRLDDKEKQQRYTERTLPGKTMEEYLRERNAIQQATERLAQYAPEPGNEDCPICFVFDVKNIKLDLSLSAVPSAKAEEGLVRATCSSCGFSGSIPRQ